jgi:hypothetical protein
MKWPRVRVTIGGLMAAMATFAVFLGLLLPLGGLGYGLLAIGSLVSLVAWLALGGSRERAARVFAGSAGLTTGLVAWASVRFFTGTMTSWWEFMGGLGVMALGVPIILGSGAAWAVAASRPGTERRRPAWVVWPLVVIAVSIAVSIPLSHWPLRLSFQVCRGGFDRLADRVAAGESVGFPARVGLFVVVGSAIDPATGNVGLVTDSRGGGESGFARASGPGPRRPGPFGALNWDIDLGGGWHCQVGD